MADFITIIPQCQKKIPLDSNSSYQNSIAWCAPPPPALSAGGEGNFQIGRGAWNCDPSKIMSNILILKYVNKKILQNRSMWM